MATKKIPTYESNMNVQSGFRAPTLKSATNEIFKPLVNVGNEILDRQAATEGKEKGFSDIDKGAVTIEQAEKKSDFTIRGSAYKEGARASFVSKKRDEIDSSLAEAFRNNQFDLTAYTKEKDRLRTELLKTTPASLQQSLATTFDQTAMQWTRKTEASIFAREQEEQVTNQTNRINTLIETLNDAIMFPEPPGPWNDFGSTNSGEAKVAEIFTLLDSLYNKQKVIDIKTLGTYSDLAFSTILQAEIRSAYDTANKQGKGKEFIEKFSTGGHKGFLKDFQKVYADEIKKALPNFEIPSTLSQKEIDSLTKILEKEYNADVKMNASARQSWKIDADNAIKNYTQGNEPGYIFDSEKMRALGFDETTILQYETKFRIAEAVYPEINKSKGDTHIENTALLKSIQSDLFKLNNKPNKTAEDRENLLVLTAKAEGIGTVLANQQKFIKDGDINLLFDQAGLEYDTSTIEGIEQFHKDANTIFGLDDTLMKVVPQSQIDQDSELLTTGSFANMSELSKKYGKYFEKFIADAGLVNTGYQTIAMVSKSNPAMAEQMFNALKNFDENTKTAKRVDPDYSKSGGALENFKDDFMNGTNISGFDGFGEYISSNRDMSDDIMNSAEALWTQIYSTTGDAKKANEGVVTFFNNNFNKFDYNGMKVLLPNNISVDKVKEKLDLFTVHPQKHGILTGNLVDVNDFKADFEDNTFDNYALAIDGGTLKIINKENAIAFATVFRKLPSGSGEVGVTNTINIHLDDDTETQATTVDVVDIWDFKANVGNKKLTTVVNEKVAQKDSDYKIKKSEFDAKQKEINENINLDLYDKYKAFDENGDGNITGSEYAKLLEAQSKNRVEEPDQVTNFDKIEVLMMETEKLNAPLDEGINFISKDVNTHKPLQAISVYIKDGEIADFIIDYLSELESFEALKTQTIRDEVLKNWKNNMDRTTIGANPTQMSPLYALYDYVRDLQEEIEPSDITSKSYKAQKDVLMLMSGMSEAEAEAYIKKQNQ